MQFEGGRPNRRALGLTPLIDVVFLLLIFFMLTTRFSVEHQLPLRLEIAASEREPPGALGVGGQRVAVVVRLDADGATWLAGERIDSSALTSDLAEALRAQSLQRVSLTSEGAVSVQRIVTALRGAGDAGARDVSLAEAR